MAVIINEFEVAPAPPPPAATDGAKPPEGPKPVTAAAAREVLNVVRHELHRLARVRAD